MDDELKPTLFDEQLQSKELQILKTSIPYLQEPQQKNLAIALSRNVPGRRVFLSA